MSDEKSDDTRGRVLGPTSAADQPVASWRYTTTQDLHDAARARGDVIGGEAKLEAEAERLRAALSRVNAAFEKTERDLLVKQGDLEGEVERLRAENERLTADLGYFKRRDGDLHRLTEKLADVGKENAELRTAYEYGIAKLEADNALAKHAYASLVMELAGRNAENERLREQCADLQEIAARVHGSSCDWPAERDKPSGGT
jgi:chromosome segregation ATPase